MEKPPLIEVEWLDSMAYTGWHDREERIKDLDEYRVMIHWSVGYLLKETDTYLAVCESLQEQGDQIGHVIQIPQAAVLSKMELRRD